MKSRQAAPKRLGIKDQFHGDFSTDQRECGFACCLNPTDGTSLLCMVQLLARCGPMPVHGLKAGDPQFRQ